MTFKAVVYVIISSIGATLVGLLGGWDIAMQTLVTLMVIDFITGLFVAILKKSPKTDTGGLSSKISFLGLCRKFTVIMFILVSSLMDSLLQTSFIRDAAIIGFSVNELLSIVENAGLLGVPLPAVISQAIDILKKKTSETNHESNGDTNG